MSITSRLRCSSRKLLLVVVVVLSLATNVQCSSPEDGRLRGVSVQRQRRRNKEDKGGNNETPEPTVSPTSSPTFLPSATPSLAPSSYPSLTPSTQPSSTPSAVFSTFSPTEALTAPVSNPEELPTAQPVSQPVSQPMSPVPTSAPTSAPTTEFPVNQRELYPFSITIDGILEDEAVLREDLETYLLHGMSATIPSLLLVELESAPSAFDESRNLQQATILRYEGVVTVDMQQVFDDGPPPTTEEVQAAQLEALEAPNGLSSYFSQDASHTLTILKVQVADFDAVDLIGDDFDPVAEDDDNDTNNGKKTNNTGVIVGVVIAVLVVGTLIGLFVHREFRKPPPPPPYDFELDSQGDSVGNVDELNKNLKMAITRTMSGSDGVASPRSSNVSPKNNNDRHPPKLNRNVAIFNSASSDGMEVIDLTKPAKHANGVELIMRETRVPSADGDGDSTLAEIRTIESNDESMAGYSLATDGPYLVATTDKKESEPLPPTVTTPPRRENQTENIKRNSTSPQMQSNAQIRWFEQPRIQTKRSEGFVSSDSESTNITLDEVANPLRDAATGEEKQTEVFVDSDDDQGDLVSQTSDDGEEDSSSFKEDDSARGDSIMSSSTSDTESTDGVFTTPVHSHGALGYFEEEEEQVEDFDILPQVTPSRSSYMPDNLSDVPSDERNDDRQMDQDLSGFSNADTIHRGLNRFSSPDRPTTEPSARDRTNIIPSDGSWEENPELMGAWVRERRRIKREARNRREERKQPPLTMEV